MTEKESFYKLKEEVLSRYQESYPYFVGNWKSFSSQDILNLIEEIFEETKQTVSEKWIYTHLKPENNEKLPRKDMLDILCIYVHKISWDEYRFNQLAPAQEDKSFTESSSQNVSNKQGNSTNKKKIIILLVGLLIVISLYFFWFNNKNTATQLEFKNVYTNEKLSNDEVKVYKVEDTSQSNIILLDSKVKVTKPTKIVITSPLFKSKEVAIQPTDTATVIDLYPNDYAMMLNAFMKSDIKNWKTRKEQLEKILSDDVEVLVMLKNNLGVEYFNKEEFSQKIIVPTPSIKKMKIIELKSNTDQKISFLRIGYE